MVIKVGELLVSYIWVGTQTRPQRDDVYYAAMGHFRLFAALQIILRTEKKEKR